MTSDERVRLVLAFARILFVNGQATEQTVSAAERLARALGLSATIVPHWGGLELLLDDQQAMRTVQVSGDPAGIDRSVNEAPSLAGFCPQKAAREYVSAEMIRYQLHQLFLLYPHKISSIVPTTGSGELK